MIPEVALRHAHTFCAVVDGGSFTAAARRLGVTPAGVSRAIAALEAAVGTQLVRRTTRRMSLTDEGLAFGDAARRALALLAEATATVSAREDTPRGRIRLSVPTTYGHHRVLPVVAAFRAAHPEVWFEVDVANRNIDFVAEDFDLAVRMGGLGDSGLVVRKLEDAALGVYASPDYLERAGTPTRLEQLAGHTLIAFIRPSSGRALPWVFRGRRGAALEVEPKRGLRCGDDFLGCVTLARAGAGLVQAYRFIVERDVAAGTLVEVLTPFAGRSRPFQLLSPRRSERPAVRQFADALVAACRSA